MLAHANRSDKFFEGTLAGIGAIGSVIHLWQLAERHVVFLHQIYVSLIAQLVCSGRAWGEKERERETRSDTHFLSRRWCPEWRAAGTVPEDRAPCSVASPGCPGRPLCPGVPAPLPSCRRAPPRASRFPRTSSCSRRRPPPATPPPQLWNRQVYFPFLPILFFFFFSDWIMARWIFFFCRWTRKRETVFGRNRWKIYIYTVDVCK